MLSTNTHKIINSQLTWDEVVDAVTSMQTTPSNHLLQKQISYVLDAQQDPLINPHSVQERNGRVIVSLFHQRFNDHFGPTLYTIGEAFSSLDFESPMKYNLGRCTATSMVFSKDHQFVIKSVTQSNFKHFKKVFYRDYFALIETQNPSLIARIYGVFSISSGQNQLPLHLVLMENLFHATFGGNVIMVFDLKGASVNRNHPDFQALLEKQRESMVTAVTYYQESSASQLPAVKGKDNDFLSLNELNPIRKLTAELKLEILKSILAETEFLQNSKIMDYSLMIVLTQVDGKISSHNTDYRSISLDGSHYLTIGIIDYLQDYNPSKMLETKFKSMLGMFKQSNLISCIDSEKYRARFLEFCEGVFQ